MKINHLLIAIGAFTLAWVMYSIGFYVGITRQSDTKKSHIHIAPLRVYQIEIESQDTCALYDGNRLVGKFFLTDDSEIGNLIIYDQK